MWRRTTDHTMAASPMRTPGEDQAVLPDPNIIADRDGPHIVRRRRHLRPAQHRIRWVMPLGA
jgi:hypothetical protein